MEKTLIEVRIVNGAFWWFPHTTLKNNKRSSSILRNAKKRRSMHAITKDKKRLSRMLRLCSKVPDGDAKVFMTLNFDYNVKAWTLDECLKQLGLFKRYLHRHFPHAWFVYILDYSNKTGIHAHFWGRFRKAKAKAKARKKWMNLTNSTNPKMFHTRKSAEYDVHYMAASSKRPGRLKLLSSLGRKHSWGVVNKSNLPQLKPKRYILSEADWYQMQVAVLYHLGEIPNASKGPIDKIFNQTGAIYLGLTPAILRQILEHIRACRGARHE